MTDPIYPCTYWELAKRTESMNPSAIREILKVTARPNIISFAGGLPSPKTFPIEEFRKAFQVVLATDPQAALQYTTSEGDGSLREQITDMLPWKVDADQILITSGSQQGLDLVSKVLIDKASRVLVETPTYLGALQAFTPMEPEIISIDSDDEGPLPESFVQQAGSGAQKARLAYLLPNFQNPTGRTIGAERRRSISQVASEKSIPIIEDNPYGDLWFDEPPTPPLSSLNPDGCIYLGSFSKILAPGLRLGFLVAPKALYPKLLQAKQAADLHSSTLNQRIISQVMQDGFLDKHTPTIRALYKLQRDVMLQALAAEMPASVTWNKPLGGMFLWVKLPKQIDTTAMLAKAVDAGVAYVPGAPFYANEGANKNTMRLSFVTASEEEIQRGIKILAGVIAEHI